MMTTSSATTRPDLRPQRPIGYRVPVALLVVAGLTLVVGVVRNPPWSAGHGADALPSPADMAALSVDRVPTVEIVELWEGRVEAAPESVEDRSALASSMLQLAGETGNLALYADAEAVARSAVDLDPMSEAAVLALAAALSGQHDFVGAADLLAGVLEANPESIGARLALGDARLELGDTGGAGIIYAELAFELGGEEAVLSRLARLHSLTGDIEQARDEARAALVVAGSEDLDSFTAAFFWFQLANYEFRTGRYDDAHERLAAALEIQPLHLGATELLGHVLIAEGQLGEATSLFEQLITKGPAADLHGVLANLYRAEGRTAEADMQVAVGFEVAAVQAAAYPAERRHLIGFYADHDPARAVELARDDLTIRQDVASYGWLGWALLQNGQVAEAADLVDEMLAQGTEDAWLLYQAGSILAAAGDDERAAGLLDRALDLSPRFDLVHADRAATLLVELRG